MPFNNKEYYKKYYQENKEKKDEYQKEYSSRPENKANRKEYHKEYYTRPENKERLKEYQKKQYAKPENKEKANERQKKYQSRPEIKEKVKKRRDIPENIAKAKTRKKTPEYKARAKETSKKYESRPEIKEKRIKAKSDIKLEVFTHYSKTISNSNLPICACCKYDDIRALNLDHIIPRSKLSASEKLLPRGGPELWNYLKRNNYPKKYQVLCANCNSMKRTKPECPHKFDKDRKYWKMVKLKK